MNGSKIQSYAINIEHDLTSEYNCDRFGIGGIANSDHIRRVGFYHCMAMVLAKYYNDDNKKLIDYFLEENYEIAGKRMDDIGLEKVQEIFEKYELLYNQINNK